LKLKDRLGARLAIDRDFVGGEWPLFEAGIVVFAEPGYEGNASCDAKTLLATRKKWFKYTPCTFYAFLAGATHDQREKHTTVLQNVKRLIVFVMRHVKYTENRGKAGPGKSGFIMRVRETLQAR